MQATLRGLLLETAREATIDGFCRRLVEALCSPSRVLTRVWVAADDGTLRLTGSAGSPVGGGTYNRLDGAFSRIPAGVGKIGQLCAAREPFIVRSLRGDESWLANPGWIARQGVRAFVGYPLIAGDDVAGALGIFDRVAPSDETLETLQFVADYAAVRLLDLRDRAVAQSRLAALEKATQPAIPDSTVSSARVVVTRAELRLLEKRTIEAALVQTRGRVFGPRGAAVLLGMKPTTLASRIKALRIGGGDHHE